MAQKLVSSKRQPAANPHRGKRGTAFPKRQLPIHKAETPIAEVMAKKLRQPLGFNEANQLNG
jgi:hypothetical protein